MRKLSIATLIFSLAAATPAVAAPEGSPPPEAVASAHVSGTMLVVSPKVAYSSATLRVAGPEGYEAIAWSQGGDVTLDLLADGRTNSDRQPAQAVRALPDGRYGYEAVLHTETGPQVHSGKFQVERGVVRQRSETPSPGLDGGSPSPEVVENDEIIIVDDANDGVTLLRLESFDIPPAGTRWEVNNTHEDLQFFQLSFDSSGAITTSETRATIKDSGNVGIGTTQPQADLHIFRPGARIRIADSSACPNPNGTWQVQTGFEALTFFVVDGCPGDDTGLKMSLRGDGNLGIGTLLPERGLHVRNDSPGVRFDHAPSGHEWDLQASDASFVVRNVTNGQVPLVIQPNAPSVRSTATGLGIGVAVPTATLHVGGSGRIDGDVALGSSRTLKTAFDAVDPAEVLARVADLPVASWRYKADEEDKRHIGPFAEDFQRLFGLGDGETISVIDAQGVTLAAIQGLDERLDQELTTLRATNAAFDAENRALSERLATIEQRLKELSAGRD